uniref:Secreted protein n=1 Tax=Oscillatoriales cyanobacterium SpSt-402 TaxID=2282168 RepID=A0A832H4H9_9CYAN
MGFNYVSAMYSLVLSATAIALTQSVGIAQTSFSQLHSSQHSNSTHNHSSLTAQMILTARPGLPGRRVGGGSRLY